MKNISQEAMLDANPMLKKMYAAGMEIQLYFI